MFQSRFSFLLSSLLVTLALSADVNINFDISNAVVAPDGFSRAGVIVNGVFPGTLIQAQKDDVLHITANNQLSDPSMPQSLTIHWHGLFQLRTASEDGPAFVNQCPVSPGHSYTYDIPLNGQPGTFWYHSHMTSQYVDGLRGGLIVYDPEDPYLDLYDVDDENTVISLADWYHLPSHPIEEKYLFRGNHHEPIPDSGLINGKGRYVGGPRVERARINVTRGLRYRFRVISMAAYASFEFSIESHSLTIIEVDGVPHEPLTVDSFEIYAGQRYSVIVTANQPIANYWISAPMDMQHSSDNDNLDEDNVFAVLHYEGAPSGEPTSDPDFAAFKTEELEEHKLRPLINPGAPGGNRPADRVIDLRFTRDEVNGELEWTVNDSKYISPDLPTLLNIMANGFTSEADFAPSENTYVLERDQVVELVIHGSANGHVHPFHLHGHVFDVIQGMNGGVNYVNPPRRDVVGVKGSNVIIRFRTDNPGPWILHCHLDWHLVAGLAVVFAEAPSDQVAGPDAQIIKQEWLDLCPIYNALPPAQQ